ncbi:MAG: hypothetical protein H6672_03345 [Anaerolineaceae bacterium]|nr:hypothetical protein [Anaerolineaceae bacterium]
MIPNRLWLLLFVLCLNIPAAVSAQTACPAPENLPTRLSIGLWARIPPEPGPPNNVRVEPGTAGALAGQLTAGQVFAVVDGPRCADGYVWWAVEAGELSGWTVEGDAESYWLEPLTAPIVPDDGSVLPVCAAPPEDYTRVTQGNAVLNARTLAMLDHAEAIYRALGGETVNFRLAITQGSYTGGYVAASFGTHDGGGAVDLSVRSPQDFSLLEDDIPLMLQALRLAGFAAWLREADQLSPGSPIHIHAIAIGDAELSEAARAQIDGPFGYLRGYDGLPQDNGVPQPDTSGDLILCDWLAEHGWGDLREAQ